MFRELESQTLDKVLPINLSSYEPGGYSNTPNGGEICEDNGYCCTSNASSSLMLSIC